MEIMEWKERIVRARKHKFPKDDSPQDSLLALLRQAGDVSELIQIQQGVRQKAKMDKSIPYAITCILVDFFNLCALYNIDLDKELTKIEQWFLRSNEAR